MKPDAKKNISRLEQGLIIGGGIAGFLSAYLPTGSWIVGAFAGAPSGIAGICIALILCKKFRFSSVPN